MRVDRNETKTSRLFSGVLRRDLRAETAGSPDRYAICGLLPRSSIRVRAGGRFAVAVGGLPLRGVASAGLRGAMLLTREPHVAGSERPLPRSHGRYITPAWQPRYCK